MAYRHFLTFFKATVHVP